MVRFTPDRAGTFTYHTHAEEAEQLSSGLYGPLIVLEPSQTYDPETDRIFLLGWGGPGGEAPPILNGSPEPGAVTLAGGVPHRFRFINITPSNNQQLRLVDGEALSESRRVGKDGADYPANQAVSVPAEQYLGAGVQPTATTTGDTITPAVEVSIQDAFGNTDTTATDSVTLGIANNPAGGTLSGEHSRCTGRFCFMDRRRWQPLALRW